MAEKKEIIKEKLEHTGVFDFSDFYGYAHSWLKDRKYGIIEKKYSEKIEGNKKNITVEWEAKKDFSDYFRFQIDIKIEAKSLTDVEVEIDGERRKMNKGIIEVEFKGIEVRDPEGKWEGSPLWRLTRDFYNKFIIPGRVHDMQGQLTKSIIDLKDELKAFLELTAKR